MQKKLYVGLDVHKVSISVSAAEEERNEVRFIGPIPNSPGDVSKLADGQTFDMAFDSSRSFAANSSAS
jgi:hypothetical protein